MRSFQQDLRPCEDWAYATAAVFNPHKCVHMTFTSSKSAVNTSRPSISLNLHGTVLDQATEHCHLGITLTPILSFDRHVQTISTKFRARVFLLSHMSRLLPFAVQVLYPPHSVMCSACMVHESDIQATVNDGQAPSNSCQIMFI